MRLVVTENAQIARTVWAALSTPDNTASVHVDVASLVTIKSIDSKFEPIWSFKESRSLANLTRQARSASSVVMAFRAGPEGDWAAKVLTEFLRQGGTGVPIVRAPLDDLDPATIEKQLAQEQKEDRSAEHWRAITLEHILGKSLKKFAGTLTGGSLDLMGLTVLVTIARASMSDDRYLIDTDPYTVTRTLSPTLIDLIADQSGQLAPDIVARDVQLMMDSGHICRAFTAADTLPRRWAIYYEQIDAHKADWMVIRPDWLSVTHPEVDPRHDIAPQFRPIWWFLFRAMSSALSRNPLTTEKLNVWGDPTISLRDLPVEPAMRSVAALRGAELIRGWSYLRPTSLGWWVLANLKASWPLLVESDFLDAACTQSSSTNLVRCFSELLEERAKEPMVDVACECGAACRPFHGNGRVRLRCEDPSCMKSYPISLDIDWSVKIASPRRSLWWCRGCSALRVHAVTVSDYERYRCSSCGTDFID